MKSEFITWDQIEDILYQLQQVADAAKKTAATLKRHQVKTGKRIQTLESQRNELEKSASLATRTLDRYTSQLRTRISAEAESNE